MLYANQAKVPVLGYNWNARLDVISIKAVPIATDLTITKRHILSSFTRVYDPLGLFEYVKVRCKILMQDLFIAKLDWDVPIPQKYIDEWLSIVNDIHRLPDFGIPRTRFTSFDTSCTDYDLFVFGDSSKRAMGSTAYLSNGKESFLLKSVSRIHSIADLELEELTCPKGELTSAFIAAKLADYLVKQLYNLKLTVYLFTDSEIVLRWFLNCRIKGYQKSLVK